MSAAGRTLLYGLIGTPVSQSLSPYIMNRAFQEIGFDAVYVAFGIRPGTLEEAVNGLFTMGAAGINVTYPFKEEILYTLDVISSDAELAHAVNTLVFLDHEVHGYNTDAPGATTALEAFAEVPLEGNTAFIFGGGGSARAAAYGLLERGVDRLVFGMRSQEKAEMIVERYRYAFPEQEVDFTVIGESGLDGLQRDLLRDSGIVVNATPVGMAGVDSGNLIADANWIDPRQCFFDFVYQPSRTPFLETARAAGAKTLGGLAMLVSQAVESFRLWTDQTFDVKDMAQSVELYAQTESTRGKGVN